MQSIFHLNNFVFLAMMLPKLPHNLELTDNKTLPVLATKLSTFAIKLYKNTA